MKPLAISLLTYLGTLTSAYAVDTATARAGATITGVLEIEKTDDLNFGTILPNPDNSGQVQVFPDNGNVSQCDVQLVCLQPAQQAVFTVTGSPNQQISIQGPGSIILLSAEGHEMLVDTFSHTIEASNAIWRGWETIGSTGLEELQVGATLHVQPGQPPGDYVGTFILTVEYQ